MCVPNLGLWSSLDSNICRNVQRDVEASLSTAGRAVKHTH